MPQDRSPGRWRSFAIGSSSLALMSIPLSYITQAPYWLVLAMVFATAVLTAIAVGVVAAGWLFDKSSKRGQLRLSWLFVLIGLLAVYLSLIRWTVVRMGMDQSSAESWIGVAFVAVIAFAFAFLPALYAGEPVLWFAAWAVRALRGRTRDDMRGEK